MYSFNLDNTMQLSDSSLLNPSRLGNLSASQPALDTIDAMDSKLPGEQHRLSTGGQQKFYSPVKNRTMKEYEQLLSDLKKENFDLKMRVYYLELKVKEKFPSDQDLHKLNVELRVRNESLTKDLQEKHSLLQEASVAVFALDESNKKVKELEAKLNDVQLPAGDSEVVLKLQGQLKQSEEHYAHLEDASNEIEALKAELAAKNDRLVELERQAEDDKEKLAQLDSAMEQIVILKKELGDNKLKLDKAENKQESFEEVKIKMHGTIDNLKLDLQKRDKAIKGLMTKASQAENEKNVELAGLEKKFDDAHSELELLRSQIDVDRRDIDLQVSLHEKALSLDNLYMQQNGPTRAPSYTKKSQIPVKRGKSKESSASLRPSEDLLDFEDEGVLEELDSLSTKLEEAAREKGLLEREKQELKEVLDRLDIDFKELVDSSEIVKLANKELTDRLHSLIQERDTWNETEQNLVFTVESLKFDNEALLQQIKNLEEHASSGTDNLIAQLRSEVDNLRSSLETLKKEKEETTAKLKVNDEQRTLLNQQLEHRSQQLDDLQTQLRLADEYVSDLKTEMQANESRHMTLESSFQSNREELETLKTQLVSTNDHLVGINESLRHLSFSEERRNSGESDLEAHLVEIRALRKKLEEAIDHNEELRLKLEEQLSMNEMVVANEREILLRQTVDENRVLANGLKDLRQVTEELKQNLNEKTEQLKQQKDDFDSREKSFVEQLTESQGQLSQLHDNRAHLQNQLAELEKTNESLCSQLDTAQPEMEKLTSRNEFLCQELDAMRDSIKSKKDSVAQLELELELKNDKVFDLEKRLELENANVDKGRNRIVELEVEIGGLQDDAKHQTAENNRLSNMISEMEDKIDLLERKARRLGDIEDTLVSRNELVMQLESEIETKASRIESLVAENEMFGKNVEILKAAISDLELRIKQGTEERMEALGNRYRIVTELHEDLAKKESEITKASKVIEALRDQLARVATLQQEQNQNSTVLRDALQSRDEFAKQLEKELSWKSDKIQKLDGELAASTEQVDSLRNILGQYEVEGNALKQIMKAQEDKISNMEKNLEVTKQLLEEEKIECSALKESIDQQRQELEQRRKEVEDVDKLKEQFQENEDLNRTLKLELSVYEAMQKQQTSPVKNEIFSLLLEEIRHLRIQLERCIEANNALRLKLEDSLEKQTSLRREFLSSCESTPSKAAPPKTIDDQSLPERDNTLTASFCTIDATYSIDRSKGGLETSPIERHRDSGITDSIASTNTDPAVRKLFHDSSAALKSLLTSPPSVAFQPPLSTQRSDGEVRFDDQTIRQPHRSFTTGPTTDKGSAAQARYVSPHKLPIPVLSSHNPPLPAPRFTDITNLRFAAPQEFSELHPELIHPAPAGDDSNQVDHVPSNSPTMSCSGDDHGMLKARVADCLVVLGGIKARLAERLKSFGGAPPVRSMEYTTLKHVLASVDDLTKSLQKQQDVLMNKFTINDATQQAQLFRRKYKSALKSLDHARKRLATANERKENAKEGMIDRLTRTQEVLQKARHNLQSQAIGCGLNPPDGDISK